MFDGVLLSGTNELSLDNKGRFIMPARYRDVVLENSDNQIVITRSLFDKCLWVYLNYEWESVVASLGNIPNIADPLTRTVQRVILGSAVFVKLDAQNRVVIPPELRNLAELDKKAYLIGFNNKFELWSEHNFEAQRKQDQLMLEKACNAIDSNSMLKNIRL